MENFEVKIVLGSTFGDEGKGVTVQSLCKEAIDKGKKPLVIRFSGGPQAAHTINNNGVEHVCSSYGSGVLLGVPTLIWDTAYFDPICAKNEYEALKTKMDEVPPLYVMPKTRVITPYDVYAGRNDLKVIKDGTCGKGIYPTFKRNKEGFVINLDNMLDEQVLYELELNYYDNDDLTELSPEGKMYENFIKEANEDKYNFFSVTGGGILLSLFDVLIFEGSQGLLLDMDRGFYPNVTPSKVGLNAFTDDKFLEKALYNAEVYLVTRTYLTRHGNGYTPCNYGFPFDLTNKHETNVYNDFQGNFKYGLLNFDLLNEAFTRHCLDNYWKHYNITFNLVVTHWDLINQVNEYSFICNKDRTRITRGDFPDGEFEKTIADAFRYFPKDLRLKNVFVNDSIESNLKKLDF